MGVVQVNRLKHGMILAEDARDIASRLLLSRGQRIHAKHIRILRIWGVSQVVVEGDDGDEQPAKVLPDPERLEEAKKYTKIIFAHLDRDHPTIRELFECAVLHRAQNDRMPYRQHRLNPDDDAPSRPHALIDVRERIDKSEIKLPEVPSIVFELNEVVSAPLVSASDIARIVQRSPSLTSLLLRIVNSAFYGLPSRVDDISRAVTLIGSKETSGLALGISTMTMFKDIPQQIIDTRSFMKHSIACGIISRILAARNNIPQTEQLFVSGLLHDIGRLIAYKYFPGEAKGLLQMAMAQGQPLYPIEPSQLGCRHTDIAQHLLRKWKLPFSLENNIFFHHRPSSAPDRDKAAIVHMADLIANGLGLGSSGERFPAGFDEAAWDKLNMTPGVLTSVVEQAIHQLGSMEAILL